MKTISKYLSILLIIIVLNSNFSFALVQMICKMNEVQKTCECSVSKIEEELKLNEDDQNCCKNNVQEINNSNTLDKNNTTYKNVLTIQSVIYLVPQIEISKPFTDLRVYLNYHKPPSDIPILISSFLI